MVEIWNRKAFFPAVNQRLKDKIKQMLKREWFNDIVITEIFWKVGKKNDFRKKSPQKMDSKKQEIVKLQSLFFITTQNLIQEGWDESLPSLRNNNWNKVILGLEKVNKLQQYIPTQNITKLNNSCVQESN